MPIPLLKSFSFYSIRWISVYKFLSAKNSAFLRKIEANSSWNLAKIKLSAPYFSEIQFSFHFRHADEISDNQEIQIFDFARRIISFPFFRTPANPFRHSA